MKLQCLILVAHTILLSFVPTSQGESSVTTETLVKRHGYPFENHYVKTPDGYILSIHRIPYSSRVNTSSPRPVVFLMHGLLASSSCWVIPGPDIALPYMLSNAGFDVWLGNARGSRFSRRHVTRSTQSQSFWNFDWHEIGMIDLPTMIDYIRLLTGEKQVRYIGHSQGTTTFLALNSMNLKFKNRIKSAHLLAPVAFMNHMALPLARIASKFFGQPNPFVDVLGSVEVLRNSVAFEEFGKAVCGDKAANKILCFTIFSITGNDPENLNTKVLADLLATAPAGASINQILHYLQEYNSGYFRQFDYGPTRNQIKYGSKNPPNYPLENINLPIFLYYSLNDMFASVVDVKRLIRQLSNSTLRRAYQIPFSKFTHLDFIVGLNVKEQVYDVVMEDIASMK